MKKLIAVILAVAAFIPVISAQEVVLGTVVDKYGNPLPGVKIEIPGTPETVISDLDGTFTINRSDLSKKKLLATYAGMSPRKMKMKDGMVVKMKETNWWNRKPDKWDWFVEAIVAIPNDLGNDLNPSYGLMVGRVKKFGYYVKGVTNTFGKDGEQYDNDGDSYVGFMKKRQSTYWSVTAGGIVRLGCPIHFYAGIGYAEYNAYFQNISGDWYYGADSERHNFVVDFGFMMRIKRITVSLGTTMVPRAEYFHHKYGRDKFGHETIFTGNFGIGYSF